MKPNNEAALLEVVKAARGLLVVISRSYPGAAMAEKAALTRALANLDRCNP